MRKNMLERSSTNAEFDNESLQMTSDNRFYKGDLALREFANTAVISVDSFIT